MHNGMSMPACRVALPTFALPACILWRLAPRHVPCSLLTTGFTRPLCLQPMSEFGYSRAFAER